MCMFPNTCTLFHHSFSASQLSYNAQDATHWLSERPAIKGGPEKTLKHFYLCIFVLFIYLFPDSLYLFLTNGCISSAVTSTHNNEVQAMGSASYTFQELLPSFISETVVPLTASELQVHRPLPVLHADFCCSIQLSPSSPEFIVFVRGCLVSPSLSQPVSPHPCPSRGPPPSPLPRG